jgi:hypothetical protein
MSGHCKKCGHDACCCKEMSESDTPRTDAADRNRQTESNFLHYRDIVKHAQQLERELDQAIKERDGAWEYIRARPPFECDWHNLSEHKQGCLCDECGLWRKAAGLDDPNTKPRGDHER